MTLDHKIIDKQPKFKALSRLGFCPSTSGHLQTLKRFFHTSILLNMVQAIRSFQEFKDIIAGDKVVAIDFWADWCGPCRAISPIFEKLDSEFPEIAFYKVDVDDQADISQECGVRAMPTFMFFKGGEKIDDLVGANPGQLMDMLKRHQAN